VRERVKTSVSINQTFTDVKKNFNVKLPEDQEVILCYYKEAFLTTLPQKGKRYLQSILVNYNEKFLIEWLDVVYGPKPNNKLEELLKDAEFHTCLTDLKSYDKNIDFMPFLTTLRNNFRDLFIETKDLQGIFEIYQCLLRCERLPHQSMIFRDALLLLWKKCGIKNCFLSDKMDNISSVDPLHQQLKTLVDNFSVTTNETVTNLIKVSLCF
jgi:hypothetical protein